MPIATSRIIVMTSAQMNRFIFTFLHHILFPVDVSCLLKCAAELCIDCAVLFGVVGGLDEKLVKWSRLLSWITEWCIYDGLEWETGRILLEHDAGLYAFVNEIGESLGMTSKLERDEAHEVGTESVSS